MSATFESSGFDPCAGESPVVVSVELSDQAAWDLAELLKRLCFADVRSCAVDNDEAYRMIYAAERVRSALTTAGYSPR